MWAVFERGGSTNTGLAKGIIFGMFFMLFGYAGVLNTFAPVVSPHTHTPLSHGHILT